MKKIFLILFAIVIVVGGGVLFAGKKLKTTPSSSGTDASVLVKTAQEAKDEMATVIPKDKPDYSKDGHLIIRDEGTETEYWILLFDEPGSLASTVTLNFNNRSFCDFGSGEQVCNTGRFEVGTRVHIEGNKKGDTVTVTTLKLLNEQ